MHKASTQRYFSHDFGNALSFVFFPRIEALCVVNLGTGRPLPYMWLNVTKSDHLGAHTMHIRYISMRRK